MRAVTKKLFYRGRLQFAWLEKLKIDKNFKLIFSAHGLPENKIKNGERVGPLAGVPLAHKDMFYREGKVTTCGSKIRSKFKANQTSTALDRLSKAGAIYLGGLNMSEFAVGPIGNLSLIHISEPTRPY